MVWRIRLRTDGEICLRFLVYSFLCFANVVALTYHFRNFKQVSNMLVVLKYSFQQSYPILYLILIVHILFGIVGSAFYGGLVNDGTRDEYRELTGSNLPDGFE